MFIIKTNWAKRVVTPEFDWMPDRVDDFLQLILDKTINSFTRIFDRRSFIKFNRSDYICLDDSLSDIILPLVKEIRRDKQGIPYVDNEDVPEELRTEEDIFAKPNHTDKEIELLTARWDYILGEIEFAFTKLLEGDWESEFHSGNIDFKFTPIDKDGNEVSEEDAEFFRMDKGPEDTHKLDIEGLKAMDARITNGTKLFGKYYRALWL